MSDTKELVKEKESIVETKIYKLILHNDDYNSMDWIISNLVSICRHNPLQAEQCATIAHFNGKSHVDSGEEEKIKEKSSMFRTKGIITTVE